MKITSVNLGADGNGRVACLQGHQELGQKLTMVEGWPRDVSRRELGQVTPVVLPVSKVPGSGAFTGKYNGRL